MKVKLSLKQAVEDHRVVTRRDSPIFHKIGSKMAVKLSAVRDGSALLSRNIPGTNFCYRLSQPHSHSEDGSIR
jgi:hypothetical protein